MYPSMIIVAFVAFATLLAFSMLRSYWRLRHVPGPLWSRFTNIPRALWVRSGHAHKTHLAAHEKYGDFVRLGPNMVSISDPTLVPEVYPMKPGFIKGEFYRVLMPYTRSGALPAVFNTRDENLHKQIKNPIAPLFSLTQAQNYEVFVDQVLDVLFSQLDERFADTEAVFDFGDWLQYFAFDVMGTLTFSKRYGFLDQGMDKRDMLETIWQYMKTVAPVTQIPWYDYCWNKNPLVARWRQPFGFGILKIVGDLIAERKDNLHHSRIAQLKEKKHSDMLDRFLETQANNPEVPTWAPTAWTFSNVIAGSDSTGAVLKSLWYNLLAHPKSLQYLRKELSTLKSTSGLTLPYPKWSEVRDLPYLDACILEAARLHPPFCLPFERVVPDGGTEIGDRFFEGGTVVGINPYVSNRNKAFFGEDAENWRPERWLGLSKDARRKMETYMMTYGAGRRVCLGRNIALLEMKKVTPALLLHYDINIIDPMLYKLEHSWFFRQRGLMTQIRRKRNQFDKSP